MLIDLRSPDRFATKYEDNSVHAFYMARLLSYEFALFYI